MSLLLFFFQKYDEIALYGALEVEALWRRSCNEVVTVLSGREMMMIINNIVNIVNIANIANIANNVIITIIFSLVWPVMR